ncbi:MAG: M48 family metalloprotease [Natronospirillum sp.]|uniref:M48 family metalloprotease n=1 Tax=Natronospirillum sp. TaxID=2812955 RepID=UPI0025CBD21C|nr:M48 family metalloprotease [Natronospirillum sp.]MCH8552053.1 M48 family metalloprotease [Natronospirillum sp.]
MCQSPVRRYVDPVSGRLTRRSLVKGLTLGSLGLAAPVWLTGCAVDPVSGRPGLMLLSREDEIRIDQQQSPHQISADYGVAPYSQLNRYVSELGQEIARVSHRPDMPYSFQVVNANYINAYAFPGGTIGLTRGIMLEMQDEAELAALLGHEVTHVTARHAGRRVSQGMLAQVAVGTAVAGAGETPVAGVVGAVGQIGAGALLARYSRGNERDADSLGMDYIAEAGHNPEGMIGLTRMLTSLNDRKPNAIEVMFASHPTGEERMENARSRAGNFNRSQRERSLHRERYQDMMAPLQVMRPAIEAMQEGERLLARGEPDAAEAELQRALTQAPEDYTGLMLMGKLQMSRERFGRALGYFNEAESALPGEGQAVQYQGLAHLVQEQYGRALERFETYETLLPGNPGTDFLAGYCHENMADRPQAADRYQRFLSQVQSGPQAEHAYQRLVEWGYV